MGTDLPSDNSGERLAETRPARRTRRRISWLRVAHRLAAGGQPDAIAAEAGIAEERIWQHLERSAHFRALIRLAGHQRQLLAVLSDGGNAPADPDDRFKHG